MDNKNIEELVLEYLNTHPSSKSRKGLVVQLEKLGYDISQLESLETIYSQMGNISIPKPSTQMSDHFYDMLERLSPAKRKRKSKTMVFRNYIASKKLGFALGFVYTLLILCIGWMAGKGFFPKTKEIGYEQKLANMSFEIQQMKEILTINLLNSTSSTERLKGVESVKGLQELDVHVINALLNTLNFDPNPSVRLVTLQTLSKFAENPVVRSGLVNSITFQKSPMVILALTNIMISLQEKESVNYFRMLLNDEELDPLVKNKIEKGLMLLI